MSLPKQLDKQDQETVNHFGHRYCQARESGLKQRWTKGGGNQTTGVGKREMRRDQMTANVNQQLT